MSDALDETIADLEGKIRFHERRMRESPKSSKVNKEAAKKIADLKAIKDKLRP